VKNQGRTKPQRGVFGEALDSLRFLVVCGAGGVGKTTTAAALGLAAALGGRRVLVCTIDPSRRLATSLGLNRLSEHPRLLRQALPRGQRGELWAMQLDAKRMFDSLVHRYAPNEAARQRILKNRFYREISSALAGSHEYMAMEKLLELSTDPRFDLIVLDTPPTRHALDFLEAPDRLMGFLDTSVLRWFLKPYFVAGRLTLKVATRTGGLALRLADRVLGLQFLEDLSEFFLAFEGMYDGFKERAARVHALLRGDDAGFILVASPARAGLDEALYFYERLREKAMPFVGFLVNRMPPDPADAPTGRPSSSEKSEGTPQDLVARLNEGDFLRRLLSVVADQQALARAARRIVSRLLVDTDENVAMVPELEADVHDLRGLQGLSEHVVGRAKASHSRLRF